jgi:hypothetical protein
VQRLALSTFFVGVRGAHRLATGGTPRIPIFLLLRCALYTASELRFYDVVRSSVPSLVCVEASGNIAVLVVDMEERSLDTHYRGTGIGDTLSCASIF